MVRWWLSSLIVSIFCIHIYGESEDVMQKCSKICRMVEKEEHLPPLLLTALMFVESSDMPWVIGVKGNAYRYNNRKDALKKINELKLKHHKNFDVGCMQINHFFHRHNFYSDEAMLNPVQNIRYAAKFLKQLKEETGSWKTAVAYYNSRNKSYSADYIRKVYYYWDQIKLMGENVLLAQLHHQNVNYTSAIVPENNANTALQKAKTAYLIYKRYLVRQN